LTADETIMVKYQKQADMIANKVKKKYNHLRKRYARQNIEVFRLYDWDIPEIRAAVDWYAGHLVIAEYTRKQSTKEWLPMMAEAIAQALNVPMSHVHLKMRKMGYQDGKRYERLDHTNKKIIMAERDLKFYINPDDYVDTGLFSDHRNTRQMVRELADGKDFLNLYCYTAAFSCYAALGGARSTVSVDRSDTAISWARDNMVLNGISLESNELILAHTFDFLENAKKKGQKFDLAVVDPPSFSTSKNKKYDFDIVRDHTRLLDAVIRVMRKDSVLFFSTNHQDFKASMDDLDISEIQEITSLTIPEDYQSKRKKIHRCWKIRI